TVAGILSQTSLEMDLLDYVPCYRTEAGTGNAMAFATWT
ncbi:MAG: protocatechuate 3,4-dioxygenase, partial [Rhodospirillaceae bacterium]|nr:protocatechuate 3,4-dioxygenase [Rhodospirillaceae bacterium]